MIDRMANSLKPAVIQYECMATLAMELKAANLVQQVSYAIGVAQPLSVHVDTYATGAKPDREILSAVLRAFDFRPGELAVIWAPQQLSALHSPLLQAHVLRPRRPPRQAAFVGCSLPSAIACSASVCTS